MWRAGLIAAVGASAIVGAASAQDVHAQGACGDFRGTVASCGDLQRRQTLADAFAPRPTDMNSYVRQGLRARTLSAAGEARDRAELARRIDLELASGRCPEARDIALDHGLHAAAARIRRACAVRQ